jgi:hypothetical protein
MKTNIKTFYLILLSLLISCNQVNDKKSTNVDSDKKEFESKLKNEPKLFSKFWVDMSKKDFNKVVSILRKEEKIEQGNDSLFYKIDGYTTHLESSFKKNKLKKIILQSPLLPIYFSEKFSPYNIYKEKYKLPFLIRKDKYYSINTYSNSEYEGVYEVYLKNGMPERIPNSLIDNYSNEYRRFSKSKERGHRIALPEERIEINKTSDIKIILEEVRSAGMKLHNKNGVDLVYSLDDLRHKIPDEIEYKYGIDSNKMLPSSAHNQYQIFIDQKIETMGNYLIRKNSKYVTKYSYINYDLKVIYVTNKYFDLEQSQRINYEKERKESNTRNKEKYKKEMERIKKEALEEI